MDKTVIRVRGISKRYRLGVKEPQSNTFVETIANVVKAPVRNFKRLQQMSRFDSDDESVFWALKDVSFDVKEGEVLGIIGRNGAGKSTLLKILSQITEPSMGEIELIGRVASLLEVGTGFHPELSGRDNIYMNGTILGMTKREIDSKLDEIIAFSGVEKFVDTPVKFYSSGMKVRLGFSVAAHLEPEILVIDEVLAVGDYEFQKKCLGKMHDVSREGRTVLFVSHNMAAVASLCTHALVLANGAVSFNGSVSNATDHYFLNNIQLSETQFEHSTVKRFRCYQKDGDLILEMEYTNEVMSPMTFGFIVSNELGEKVIGANPRHFGDPVPYTSSMSGTISARLSAPKLRQGRYNISIWVGDGHHDFFEAIDCISINIDDMRPLKMSVPGRMVGSVIPEVDWNYS